MFFPLHNSSSKSKHGFWNQNEQKPIQIHFETLWGPCVNHCIVFHQHTLSCSPPVQHFLNYRLLGEVSWSKAIFGGHICPMTSSIHPETCLDKHILACAWIAKRYLCISKCPNHGTIRYTHVLRVGETNVLPVGAAPTNIDWRKHGRNGSQICLDIHVSFTHTHKQHTYPILYAYNRYKQTLTYKLVPTMFEALSRIHYEYLRIYLINLFRYSA